MSQIQELLVKKFFCMSIVCKIDSQEVLDILTDQSLQQWGLPKKC